MKIPRLKRGDLVNFWWVDIYEDGVGDPREAQLKPRGPTIAYFWGDRRSNGMLCGVFSYSFEEDDPVQQGYLIIPWKLITKMRRVR